MAQLFSPVAERPRHYSDFSLKTVTAQRRSRPSLSKDTNSALGPDDSIDPAFQLIPLKAWRRVVGENRFVIAMQARIEMGQEREAEIDL